MAYGLTIYTSNQLELLCELLAGEVVKPCASALKKEHIVVQGRSMALWLSMNLSRQLGVFANAEFLYPRNFIERVFELALPIADPENVPRPPLEAYRPDALGWAIFDLLPTLLGRSAFAPLERYIGDDRAQLKRFELSSQIARSFDEYLTFRPELLRTWQGDENQGDLFAHAWGSVHLGWQEQLWQALIARLGPHHFADQEPRLQKALARKRRPAEFPERISIFALTNLPPLYVRVLAMLARHTTVDVYSLTPSPAGFRDNQNTLIKGWGQLGIEVERIWGKELRILGTEPTRVSRHNAIATQTLLQRLQHALSSSPAQTQQPTAQQPTAQQLESTATLPQEAAGTRELEGAPLDDSVRVHSCHSAMREVEVLHDQVQALLETGIAPDEILVMMPNVDDYAPLVQAVFERPTNHNAVPYRISDRKPQGDSPVLEAFSRILLLADRRLAASEVLDLLGLGPVHERFEIREADLELLTRWVVESGVRWGLDETHKLKLGLPQEREHSWRFGLDRLLLGYATLSDDTSTVEGVLPYPEVEGSQGLLLGRLSQFVDTLGAVVRDLEQPRTCAEWQRTLGEVLGRLVADTATTAWQHMRVRQALTSLADSAASAHCEGELSLQVVRQWLDETFSREREARGFLSGGVNFCTLVPMRSIPFRVVCLLGMGERAFPRSTRRPDFNVLGRARERRRDGDPDRRLDDRQLFLEAVQSARDKLLLSYVGQSIRDNSQSSPSVVINELLEELESMVCAADPHRSRQSVRDELVVRHPLQPFSPRYYDGQDPRLFSFEADYLFGATRAGYERNPPKPLLSRPLEQPLAQTEVTLTALLEFFRSPAEYLLRYRLDLQRAEEYLAVPDREPVELDPLESYAVGAQALNLLLRGLQPDNVERVIRAGATLPGGAPGQVHFDTLCSSLIPMLEGLQHLTQGGPLPRVPVRLSFDSLELVGNLDHLYPAGRIEGRFARASARNELRSWLVHLVLCAVQPPGTAPFSVQICRVAGNEGAAITCFEPVSNALPQLRELLDLFKVGQTVPVALFPKTSLAFVEQLRKEKSEDEAIRAFTVQNAWNEERTQSQALQRVFGRDGELELHGPRASTRVGDESAEAGEVGTESHPSGFGGPNFSDVARRVFEPMLAHVKRLTVSELAGSAPASFATPHSGSVSSEHPDANI